MISANKIRCFNFEGAMRGMRNPLDSWDKSDSDVLFHIHPNWDIENDNLNEKYLHISDTFDCNFKLGENDQNLAQRLISAGNDHSKFMRQIMVSMDINAPLYWWKEMDQYKVSTTTNSCSTMHKITSYPITRKNFSFDEFDIIAMNDSIDGVINVCETLRLAYIQTKDVEYWRALIQVLPSAWMQKRTWTGSYATLRNIYFARKNHKLKEWQDFCKEIEELPYAEELITFKKEK